MGHVGGVPLCLSVLERLLDERRAYAADDALFGEIDTPDPIEAARNEGAVTILEAAIKEITARAGVPLPATSAD